MVSDTEAEAMLWEQRRRLDEIDALRALLRKVRGSVGWWAALSYIDGALGQPTRWAEEERELLRTLDK